MTNRRNMFIGRQSELRLLEEYYRSDRSEFCVLYGRRRIGKSTLLEKFTESHKCHNIQLYDETLQ